ncbi:glycerol-3-phosphate dehydrogenase [NAD(+)] isoform X2 [Physcomitrium patens]|uniref:Glycerol-3-phosphate dehydrogenase [NAD(+)] n=1 Tax=Physcomitrium patens TaxID=3218 RepID=A0A2K1JCS6_PHYPA|nr:glycerol-3-phosphate dehydrogenase [NAD(+)]-like isoform X2 [Physcomitrium patens]PNR39331.1 hypothetical protein PHYPA_019609 [Physcomitrium patens]|eukprot:XP_024396515.1 glycerol-3-phosphate dehydrogenase [NAD(+)]-like isoform X2 [Physcomitrella patens]
MRIPPRSILADFLKLGRTSNEVGCGGRAASRARHGIRGVYSGHGLEAAVLNIRSVGCNQLHSMTTWAPFAIGHGYHSDVRAGENTGKERIAVIGSGNWGSVAAKLVATNALSHENIHDEVRMWVFEETLANGEKLTQVINKNKINVKYLPNVNLGVNVVADPNLENTVKDATMLVFCTPHQFVESICKQLQGKVNPNAKAISLIKGMEVKPDGPVMLSKLITKHLGIDCSVLMGANIANEVAMEQFSEATVGYKADTSIAKSWVQAFATPYFHVAAIKDVEGVELCGTLKNVVAIAAGFVDGLGMGNNTKAAIMRIGLKEMIGFSKLLFPTVSDATFFESCGVADLITTCFGGRNRKVAEAYARNGGKRSFDELEAELLGGQKLQGVLTAGEVFQVLKARNWEKKFPLFATVHKIAIGHLPPSTIVDYDNESAQKLHRNPSVGVIG